MEMRGSIAEDAWLSDIWEDKSMYLRRIIEAANLYKTNLLHNNMLVIYRGQENQYFHIEVLFEERHFLHLTGVETVNGKDSVYFYNRCIDNMLSVDDFNVKDTWTTTKKMKVIKPLMSIYKNARTVGDFKGVGGTLLQTEKLMGRESGCMGFAFDPKDKYYVPNTLLKEDIRDKIDKSHQLMAVYMKSKEDEKYNRLCYVAKSLDPEQVRWNEEIESKVTDKENLKIECNQLISKPKEDKQRKKKKKPKKVTI